MKTMMMGMMAAAAGMLAVAGCGGTSPAVNVACTASQKPTLQGAGSGVFKIVQAVNYTDPASTGLQPLSNVKIRIVSPYPENATVCEGTCAATGTFSSDLKVETDINGILIFTVKLTGDGVQNLSGSLIEVADSQAPDSCAVQFSITP